MRRFAKEIFVAVAGVSVFATGALAGTPIQAGAEKPSQMPAVTTGSIDVDPPFAQRVQDCIAIWDKGTHMTKAQWKRSCQTTLQSLSSD